MRPLTAHIPAFGRDRRSDEGIRSDFVLTGGWADDVGDGLVVGRDGRILAVVSRSLDGVVNVGIGVGGEDRMGGGCWLMSLLGKCELGTA